MKTGIITFSLALSSLCMMAQETDDKGVDAVTGATRQVSSSRLSIGGYGEAVMTHNFYSQSFNRYKKPENYADDKSHGRFDLPPVRRGRQATTTFRTRRSSSPPTATCLAIRIRRYGPIPTWFSTACLWSTTSVPVGVALRRYGDAV